MSEIWSRLGIASTNDVTAIRRAYSRALKEIDTEADPASFIALREAYEQALTEAREMAEPVLAGVERDLADAEPVPAPPLREPERVLPQMELDEAPILLIQSMLFGDEPLDEAELESATRRLLADPAMDQVDLARNIEGFLAEVITRSSPRSDAMIDPCIAHFRWHQGVGDIGRPPILDWILQRQQDRAFEDQIQETNPQDFGRMLERLRRPPEEMRALTSWWQAPQIEYFLAYCQQAHPTTIEGLDGDGLQFWEARFADVRNATGVKGWVGRSRYKHVWEQRNGKIVRTAKAIGAYLLPIVGIVLFAQFVHPTNPPAQTRPFTVPAAITERPEVELDRLLSSTTSDRLTLSKLQEANPVLAAQLLSRFEGATAEKRAGGYDPYARVQSDIDEAYAGNLRAGTHKLQADYWRFSAARLRWMNSTNPAACDAFMRGEGGSSRLPVLLETVQEQLYAEVLLTSPKEDVPRDESGRFMVPGWLVQAAARRADLSVDRFVAAMDDKGDPGERCRARIALLDSALAAPEKQAGSFLEQMSKVL